jgi:hypothetical protein
MSSPDPIPEQGSLDGFADPPPPPRGSGAARVAVGLGGLAALTAASIFTMGGAFVATIGMLVASAAATRRKRPLTRRASWIGAVAAAGVAILVATAVTFSAMPAGSVTKIRRAVDSAQAASRNEPPPAWLERMAPGEMARARVRQNAVSPTFSIAFTLWATAMGGVLTWAIFSMMIGTLGWGAGLLLAFAFTGRWIAGSRTLPRPA